MKLADLVPMEEGDIYTIFASNDRRYKHLIRIENRYIKQLKQSIKSEDFSVGDWNSMVIQREVS